MQKTKNYKWKYFEDERPAGQFSKCYDCEMSYGEFSDLVLDPELWERINPSPHKGGGLLCPTCAVNRLDIIGVQEITVKIFGHGEVKYG